MLSTVYSDASVDDLARRDLLYRGEVFVYSTCSASTEMVVLAQELIADAFDGRDPQSAQYEMAVEEFAAVLAGLKPRFIHHPKCKQLIPAILAEFGCDLDKTYFDVPRLRTSTSHNYLTNGISYAFHPHRDTWYSAPLCQLNWWIPIFPVVSENVMAFHPKYFDQPVRNGSARYDYAEWNRVSRHAAAQHIRTDTREQPKPEEPVELEPQVRVVPEPGGVLIFSGNQLHSTVPNTSGQTRFSIDFRTVHVDDVREHRGAPNVDVACTGTTLRDFVRSVDLSPMPEDVVRAHQVPTYR